MIVIGLDGVLKVVTDVNEICSKLARLRKKTTVGSLLDESGRQLRISLSHFAKRQVVHNYSVAHLDKR